VFLWGLQYKLSLYDPPQASSHNAPIAKLLSKDERPESSRASALTYPRLQEVKALGTLLNSGLIILFFVSALCAPVSIYRVCAQTPPPVVREAFLASFFVRPPPVLS
jgi:hypothetical protein